MPRSRIAGSHCSSIFVFFWGNFTLFWGFPGVTEVQNLDASAGDTGDASSILRLGRSPGEGNGNPHQYSCLGHSMDRGAWRATIHEGTESKMTEHTQATILPNNSCLSVHYVGRGLLVPFSRRGEWGTRGTGLFRISISQTVDLGLWESLESKASTHSQVQTLHFTRRELGFRGLSVWPAVSQQDLEFGSSSPLGAPAQHLQEWDHVSARASYSDTSGRTPDQILVKILDLNLNIQEQQNRSRVTDIL